MITPEALFSLITLARRAGVLLLGQDAVRQTLRQGKPLLVLLAADASANVCRMLRGYEEREQCVVYFLEECRAALGNRLGLPSSQLVGIPRSHGLAQRMESFFSKEGEGNE